MFAQIVSTKKPDGKTYQYLHIVESYREGRTVKKRRVASLGIPTPNKTLSVTKAQHMTSAE
ncbi:hypothetical protein C7445_1072 [Alicyclobacillus sacchari]|uniref:Uncharacterized protein n=1 Tax=Alicyclobacillus sacchari TaxID=392010 RepID=A0A4V3HEB9_9BACL|nr:hypothetical protein C7445_1072 [Alicyclobacillus sacchari]